jgi:hypothetical protein
MSRQRRNGKKRNRVPTRARSPKIPSIPKSEAERAHTALLSWFQSRGLDLDGIWEQLSDDLEQQNRHLARLKFYVVAYEQCPDIEELQRRGYHYPPVEPDMGIENDWLRFERWVRGKDLTWQYEDVFGALPDTSTLDEAALSAELEKLFENLVSRNICFYVYDGVPDRITYLLAKQCLREPFEHSAPNTVTHIGCNAWCPGCLQRPWCEAGQELGWPEDDEAGEMVVPEEITSYVNEATTCEHVEESSGRDGTAHPDKALAS